MKRFLLAFMISLPLIAKGDNVEVDGIFYEIVKKAKLATVVRNYNCSGDVNIPATFDYDGETYQVTAIGEEAFSGALGLTSITLPEGITEIGRSAFSDRKFSSIKLPSSIKYIGDNAFYNCENLEEIVIPDGVESIGNSAFSSCIKLSSANIPNSITSISESLFAYTNISVIVIPDNIKSIGYGAFSGCAKLESVVIPNTVTSIGDNAFKYCEKLTSVTIPGNVERIGWNTFQNCKSMTFVSLPATIKQLDYESFKNCKELTDMYCYALEVPNANYSTFENSEVKYATLHVPAESVEAYKATTPWSEFGKIVPLSSDEQQKKCETPTISYDNGQLVFSCGTDGAECVSDITDTDIAKVAGSTRTLTATYNIAAYATKAGYENSDTVYATLCWIDFIPRTEGITNSVLEVRAHPVLIRSGNGRFTVTGAEAGTDIIVCNMAGVKVGSARSTTPSTTISTTLRCGETGIVKIGEKSVKVIAQ